MIERTSYLAPAQLNWPENSSIKLAGVALGPTGRLMGALTPTFQTFFSSLDIIEPGRSLMRHHVLALCHVNLEDLARCRPIAVPAPSL